MAQINQYLDTIRNATGGEQVRDAIIQALDKIHGDNPVQVTERTATMPSDGSDLEINAEGGIAYDHIVVHPASGSGSGVTKLTELEATENKEYVPDEGEYYSKVTVDVPQLNCDIMEDIYEVTENNTTIYAAEEGFDGFSAIHINVSNVPVSGSFTVRFYDESGNLIGTVLVPAYGTATYEGPNPVSSTGQIFTGWNPDPVNVTRNLDCYPKFADKTIIPGEISDNWEMICSNGGANYALGAYKNLPFSYTWKVADMLEVMSNWADHPDISQYPDATATMTADFIMYKVAVGEQGTKSTWLSRPTNCTLIFANGGSAQPGVLKGTPWGGYPGYSGSVVDRFLESIFFQTMAPCFHQRIKGVNKYHQALDPAKTTPPFNQTVINRHVWIPSIKELMTTGAIGAGYNETNLRIPAGSPVYDDSTINKTIFYDNVPNALGYFRDILGLSTQDFLDSMMATGMGFSVRDSFTSDTGRTGWYYPACSAGDGLIISYNSQQGYHLGGNLMIGFCMD